MPTLKAIRREMFDRALGQDNIGRVETIASGSTTTVVVDALKTGTVNAEKFIRKWLLRAEASGQPADRVRMVSNFSSASGTLTHAGTNYSDTTFTSEKVEIHEHEPYLVDTAITVALSRLHRLDRSIIPAGKSPRVYLTPLSWIIEPRQVKRVAWSANPGLCRNADLQKYNVVNSSGVLQPDDWTLSGSGATMARSTAQAYRNPYSLAVTRTGTDCTLSQAPGLLVTGVDDDSLVGQTVTGYARIWASVASTVRIQLFDEVNSSVLASSSYHSGGSGWEELSTAETTLASGVEGLTVRVSIETNNTTAYVAKLDAVRGALADNVRRGAYIESDMARPAFDQYPLSFEARSQSGGQWVIYSERPYPEFDNDRLVGGAADADETDAPLVTVSVGALARLFESLYGEDDRRTVKWRKKADDLYLAHMYEASGGPFVGINMPRASIAWGAGRA